MFLCENALEKRILKELSWHVMIGVHKWQSNCLHISNFNDLRKIALISALRLIFLDAALCVSTGSLMWLQGALNVSTTPDQLFTGSIAEMEGIFCNFHLMDQACVTHRENGAGISPIQLIWFSGFLSLPWGSLILPTH